MRDFYEVLGVDKNVSETELKKKYRKLAKDFHPDRNPGDPEAEKKFREIGQAYEVLKDPQKKAAYDQYGHDAFEAAAAGGGGHPGAGAFTDIFEDLFSDFMGGGRSNQQNRGSDLRYNIELNFSDAYSGLEKDIRINSYVICSNCSGSGAETGSSPSTCGSCSGSGKVRSSQGFFMVERTCQNCSGSGQVITDPCNSCRGEGRTHREKTISVKIPAGVDDGTRIRLSGEGEAGPRGAASGDLYLFVQLEQHVLFKRDGADLLIEAMIPITLAALGGAVDVPTPDGGRVRVTVPAGTQSGHRFRLKGKGMPLVNKSNKGDLYVDVITEIPISLNREQRKLLEEIKNTETPDNQPESNKFNSNVTKLKR